MTALLIIWRSTEGLFRRLRRVFHLLRRGDRLRELLYPIRHRRDASFTFPIPAQRRLRGHGELPEAVARRIRCGVSLQEPDGHGRDRRRVVAPAQEEHLRHGVGGQHDPDLGHGPDPAQQHAEERAVLQVQEQAELVQV